MKSKLEGKIFGSLKSNKISIHVGFTRGMTDGGRLWEVDRDLVPVNCRMPNTLVWVTINNCEIILIEEMNNSEHYRTELKGF